MLDFVIIDDLQKKTAFYWNLPSFSEKLSVMTVQRCEGMLQLIWFRMLDEAETGTKQQNMSIRKPGVQVCLKQINLIFSRKTTLSFNFRQQSWEFFFFPSLLYFPSVSIMITCLCFIIPLYHASSFHIVPLSLSLPISLCSVFKRLSLSALSPSFSLCVFQPPPREQNMW